MLEWMIMPLKRYADFSGRSRRKEFWSFALLNLIVSAVLLGPIYVSMIGSMAALQDGTLDPAAAEAAMATGGITMVLAVLGGIWGLATLIPNIAVSVRRLHDRDMSGWWYLGFIVLAIIPLVGLVAAIAYLVLMFLEGTKGPNRFGPDPKNPAGTPEVFS